MTGMRFAVELLGWLLGMSIIVLLLAYDARFLVLSAFLVAYLAGR